MKTFITLIIAVVLVASSRAQPTPTVTASMLESTIYFVHELRPLVTLTSAGNYEHSNDTSIRVLRLTTTELVLECSHRLQYTNSTCSEETTRPSAFTGGSITQSRTVNWRSSERSTPRSFPNGRRKSNGPRM